MIFRYVLKLCDKEGDKPWIDFINMLPQGNNLAAQFPCDSYGVINFRYLFLFSIT